MPAEWTPHERTLMAWPARREMWGTEFEQAKRDYAEIANAIGAFEPVLLAADPSQEAEARAAVAGTVEVVAIPLDDSWVRDSGPIFVVDAAGTRRVGVDFGFNAWGEKFHPYDADAAYARRVLERLGEERSQVPLVLEGGSIAVDGAGTLVTTEQCLLHPSRNPSLSREEIEAALIESLGLERVVWLGQGLVEDHDTDGHVDNIAAFVEPGRMLLQTVADEANPNHENAQENARRLRAAGIDVVELPLLPYVEHDGPPTVVPYTNYYLCNGAAIVPVMGAETDEEALLALARLYPGREIVGVPGRTLALGGGGVHCITQQVPALSG
ncbi:MAG TPA: agmatine deiminase family protein [Solirubrobacteraceae bacterium]|jgi:agmatine deiminase